MIAAARALIAANIALAVSLIGQTTTKEFGQSPASKWVEDKIDTKVEKPYLSDSGYLVLVYTLTNKTGNQIRISRHANGAILKEDVEPVSVFFKLKNPSNYTEVSESDSLLNFADKLLPTDMPVSFEIVIHLSEEAKPSWLSHTDEQQRLRTALKVLLGNTEGIVLLFPKRHLKVTLPIPKAP